MKTVFDLVKELKLEGSEFLPYGWDKAKINYDNVMSRLSCDNHTSKLVLVTALTPTKSGEGKTTMSIALHDGLRRIGVKSMLALREPSLGPVFGLKGGATGGGKSSVIPEEDINLHFTGDMHALTSSINLIAAVIDNHIFQGNELHIDPENIVWKRALDMNDRALRKVTVGQSMKKETPREEEFIITVASELMAIMCLSTTEEDFKSRVGNIIVAYTTDIKPVTVRDLKLTNAIMKLMRLALNPNLVQTLEGNPVLIHGGPFANIAHGCNSLRATKLAMQLGDITITEAGFGADLGAEKFLDIVCKDGQLTPDAVVVVATIRALKMHGGKEYEDLAEEDIKSLIEGFKNLDRHVKNMQKYGLPVVVCINKFPTDTELEITTLRDLCRDTLGVPVAVCSSVAEGSKGGVELAETVKEVLETSKPNYHSIINSEDSVYDRIKTICKEIYGAEDVIYTDKAMEQIKHFISLGFEKAHICMAKTPMSFTDNPKLLGAPSNFDIHIKEVRLSAGANFLVCLTGDVMTMPGLPKVPAAVKMENIE